MTNQKIYWVHDNFLHVREDYDRVSSRTRANYEPSIQRRTVGFRANPELNCVEYAYSICHSNDNFAKALGRTIVEGRFASDQFHRASSFEQVQENIGDSINDDFDSNMTALQHAFNSCFNSLQYQTA